jgi:hypothetical protein
MRIIPLIAAVAALFLLARPAQASESASINAILIIASSEKGPPDPRLAPYEANLRRMFRFGSYRFAAEGAAALNLPGRGSVTLPRGHKLELEAEKAGGRSIQLKVRWLSGGGTFMNTTLALTPGSPAVLIRDRGADSGEVPIVIVTAN